MKKGIALISGVIFIAFILVTTFIVYETGYPVLEKMKCSATTEKMKSSFVKLDKIIQDSLGGRGARRIVGLNIEDGRLYIDKDNDIIYWKYECDQAIYSPRVKQRIGNVVFGSNLEAKAYEGKCDGVDAYILENEHIKACFRKIGSEGNNVYYNTSQILIAVFQKDFTPARRMPLTRLEILLDENINTSKGYGYTKLVESGEYLPYGEVIAYMNSVEGIEYYIYFTLESGADFITIRSSG